MSEPVFCKACGNVDDELTRRVEELQATVVNQGIEISRKQGRITKLMAARNDEHPPEYDDAMEVCVYWRDLLAPKARSLEGPRLMRVVARLREDWTKEELMRSLWGFHCRPNLLNKRRVAEEKGGERWVDLDLLMRDSKHVEEGIAIADAEQRFDQGTLREGGSRHVASRCDCGHARGSHALFRMHGHEACLEAQCDCREFDDVMWQMREWEDRELRAAGNRRRTVPTSELVRGNNNVERVQESLL